MAGFYDPYCDNREVICPNCGSIQMREDTNFFTNIEPLEGLCMILCVLVSTVLMTLVGWLLSTFITASSSISLGSLIFLGVVAFLISIPISLEIVAHLSIEQNRSNLIRVMHIRCACCHRRYRIVRPLGYIAPWDFERDTEENSSCTEENE